MFEGITKSGFKFSIPESVKNNMELIDALADLSSGDALAMSKVCRLILGDELKKNLYDHLRAEDGTVPVLEVEKELVEIINSTDNGKNSLSSPA